MDQLERPEDFEGVTELRVHGVGGSPPEAMLADLQPRQVAGDDLAGFYRGHDVDGHHVEAYSWGGLTSRSALRALWVLLLPFSLANLAGWMSRQDLRESKPFRFLVRWIAFGLTLVYMLWLTTIVLDLIAFQCGNQRQACVEGRWWLAPLRWSWVESADPLVETPARRVVVGAVLLLVLLGLFTILSMRTRSRYEAVDPVKPRKGVQGPAAPEHPLGSLDFWDGTERASRTADLHLSSAAALIAFAVASSSRLLPGSGTGGALLVTQLAAGLVVVVAWLALAVDVPSRQLTRAVVGATVVVVLAAGWLAWRLPAIDLPSSDPVLGRAVAGLDGPLPGQSSTEEAVFWFGFAPMVLLAVLLAISKLRRRSGPEPQGADCADGPPLAGGTRWPRPFRWAGPVVVAGVATIIVDGFWVGAAIRVADLLGQPVSRYRASARPDEASIVYAMRYDGFAVLLVLTLAIVLLAALGVFAWYTLTQARRWTADVDTLYRGWDHVTQDGDELKVPQPPGERRDWFVTALSDAAWLKRVARKRWLPRAVLLFDIFLTSLVGLVVLGVAWHNLGRATDAVPTGMIETVIRRLWEPSSALLSLMPVAGLVFMRAAFTNAKRRRAVGIIWDVSTFWPRAFHPIAPPSYAERAVPELARRILRIRDKGGKVLVSAHSQGTVVAAAALLQIRSAAALTGVGLFTYGTPLRRLYSRAFPAWFDDKLFVAVRARLRPQGATDDDYSGARRWQSWAYRTDLIGGATLFDPPSCLPVLPNDDGYEAAETPRWDVVLRDPQNSVHLFGEAPPKTRGHTGYHTDPRMRRALAELADQLGGEPESPPDAAPEIPAAARKAP